MRRNTRPEFPARTTVLVGFIVARLLYWSLGGVIPNELSRLAVIALLLAAAISVTGVVVSRRRRRFEQSATPKTAVFTVSDARLQAKRDLIFSSGLFILILVDVAIFHYDISILWALYLLFLVARNLYAFLSPGRIVAVQERRRQELEEYRQGKHLRLPSAWVIFRVAFSEYIANWKPYILILAVVAVPSDLLLLSSTISNDATVNTYISFAAIIMNVALVWSMVHREKQGKTLTLAQAYYDSSLALVRYILTSVLLVIMMVPAALGASLYIVGVLGSVNSTSSAAEQLLVGLVSVLIASPSFYLLVRYTLAPLGAIRDGLRPVAALSRSRRLSLGRFWPVAGRICLMIVFLVMVSIPAIVVAVFLAAVKFNSAAAIFFEIASTLVALPLANLYMLGLYRELERLGRSTAVREVAAGATEPEPAA